jgi:hypothetical protein
MLASCAQTFHLDSVIFEIRWMSTLEKPGFDPDTLIVSDQRQQE